METAKFNVLHAIIQISETTENSRMDEGSLSAVRNEIARLADYLQVNETQALFFAVIFSLNYEKSQAAVDELARHFNVSPLRILTYHKELEDMVEKNILEGKAQRRRGRNMHLAKKNYVVPNQLIESILENKKPSIAKKNTVRDFTGFLQELDELFDYRRDEIIHSLQLFEEAEELAEQYEELDEIQTINNFGLDHEEKLLYCYVCGATIAGDNEVSINEPLGAIFDNIRDQFKFKKWLFQEKGPLFEKELLEWSKSQFRDKRNIRLTEKSLKMLFGEDVDFFMNREKMKNVIKPESIEEKALFYNSPEEERVTFMQDLLKKHKLPELQNRLKERNMPQGVTVLLHGKPGTGKTETARQLARETGREVVHVDLSDTKSMWFGESEKNVREIFDSYRNYAQNQDMYPILLFNEADALFSKRGDSHRSSVGQTENAIQNILLEQLEAFEGILVATTNLTMNLDQAFERRFLYKICFREPSTSVKSRIWKSKLGGLKVADYEKLAAQYHFSGGQIDNVARKVLTEEVLYNRTPDLERIMAFCEDEMIREEKNRIGYRR